MTTLSIQLSDDRFFVLDLKIRKMGYTDVETFLDAVIDGDFDEDDIADLCRQFEREVEMARLRGEKTPIYYANSLADVERLLAEAVKTPSEKVTDDEWDKLEHEFEAQYDAYQKGRNGK